MRGFQPRRPGSNPGGRSSSTGRTFGHAPDPSPERRSVAPVDPLLTGPASLCILRGESMNLRNLWLSLRMAYWSFRRGRKMREP